MKEVPKYGVQECIQFVGFKDLTPEEQLEVNKLCLEYYPKIQRKLKNVEGLTVHVKVYGNKGGKKKFSLHIRCHAPTKLFESCKTHDYDLARALHKSFEDLIRQIEHVFHNDATRKPKPRSK